MLKKQPLTLYIFGNQNAMKKILFVSLILFLFFRTPAPVLPAMQVVQNGIIFDDTNKLYWIQDVGSFKDLNYSETLDAINNLDPIDGASWRLATLEDIEVLFSYDGSDLFSLFLGWDYSINYELGGRYDAVPSISDNPQTHLTATVSENGYGYFFFDLVYEIEDSEANYYTGAWVAADAVDLDESLTFYYPFSGNAENQINTGNNGSVNGAVLTQDRFGNIDNAYQFDGVDDFIDMGTMDISIPVTITIWFRSSQINAEWKNVLCWDSTADPYEGIQIMANGDGRMKYRIGDKNEVEKSSGIIDGDGNWHLLVISRNTDNELNLYVDGTYEASAFVSSGIGTGHTLYIGKSFRPDSWNEFFKGDIDDIRIYGRTLSPTEIQALYSGTNTGLQTGNIEEISILSPMNEEAVGFGSSGGIVTFSFSKVDKAAKYILNLNLTDILSDTSIAVPIELIPPTGQSTGGNSDPTPGFTESVIEMVFDFMLDSSTWDVLALYDIKWGVEAYDDTGALLGSTYLGSTAFKYVNGLKFIATNSITMTIPSNGSSLTQTDDAPSFQWDAYQGVSTHSLVLAHVGPLEFDSIIIQDNLLLTIFPMDDSTWQTMLTGTWYWTVFGYDANGVMTPNNFTIFDFKVQ